MYVFLFLSRNVWSVGLLVYWSVGMWVCRSVGGSVCRWGGGWVGGSVGHSVQLNMPMPSDENVAYINGFGTHYIREKYAHVSFTLFVAVAILHNVHNFKNMPVELIRFHNKYRRYSRLLLRGEKFNATSMFTLGCRYNISLFDSNHFSYPLHVATVLCKKLARKFLPRCACSITVNSTIIC